MEEHFTPALFGIPWLRSNASASAGRSQSNLLESEHSPKAAQPPTQALYAQVFADSLRQNQKVLEFTHTHTNQTRHLEVIRDFQSTSAGVYFGFDSNFWWRFGWVFNTGFHSSIKWHLKHTERQESYLFQPPFWSSRDGGDITTKSHKSNETFVHVKELSDHINCRCG